MLAKPSVSVVCLMDQKEETSGYTVLSDAITKKMDREERKYQKAMMICVQGIGASLNKSAEALDVVDGLGQSHHDSLRNAKWEAWSKDSLMNSVPNLQPRASVIQQTLSHQNVPEYFQKDDVMKHSVEILEEEVLQTTTCTPKDIYTDVQGWTTAFEVELFSFLTLDVKIDVHEDTLDLWSLLSMITTFSINFCESICAGWLPSCHLRSKTSILFVWARSSRSNSGNFCSCSWTTGHFRPDVTFSSLQRSFRAPIFCCLQSECLSFQDSYASFDFDHLLVHCGHSLVLILGVHSDLPKRIT